VRPEAERQVSNAGAVPRPHLLHAVTTVITVRVSLPLSLLLRHQSSTRRGGQ
jgi:hypothetical protein